MKIFLGCLVGLIAGLLVGGATHTKVTVPLMFVTAKEYLISYSENAIFTADIDCDVLVNSSIEVCAELPENWKWDPFRGYVYMNIFNNSKDLVDLNKALVSTGSPHSGSGIPASCVQVKLWPGGALFIRVDGNNYQDIQYTVGTVINASTAVHQQAQQVKPGVLSLPSSELDLPQNTGGPIINLIPVVSVSESMALDYDENVTLVMDLCLNQFQPDLSMTSTLLATKGTFTQYICSTSAPCLPDSRDVICSNNTPLPVSTCLSSLKGKPKQVFATIHAAGGELDNSTHKYVSEFRFGASFQTIS